MRRKEDARLITGPRHYVDDITAGHAARGDRALARGARPHRLDRLLGGARAPGVARRLTGEDIDLGAPLPMAWVPPGVRGQDPRALAARARRGEARGRSVAVVIGEDRYAVVDAAEDVFVEYDPLPVGGRPEAALRTAGRSSTTSSAPTRRTSGRSAAATWRPASRDADVIVERRIVNHRTAGAAIEPRGVLAEYRAGT